MDLSEIKKREKEEEPLLQETSNRYVLFPIKYNNVWEYYKKAVASFWTPEEINFSDIEDWNKLSENEKTFIKNILIEPVIQRKPIKFRNFI